MVSDKCETIAFVTMKRHVPMGGYGSPLVLEWHGQWTRIFTPFQHR